MNTSAPLALPELELLDRDVSRQCAAMEARHRGVLRTTRVADRPPTCEAPVDPLRAAVRIWVCRAGSKDAAGEEGGER